MTITGRVNRISAARVEAALADGDLRGVVTALTLGSSWWADEAARRVSLVKACSADGECVCGPPEECPLRSNAAIAQHALGELAQQVVAGQLLLASGTLGAMQLLALLRAAFRWRQHAAAEAFMALAAEPGAPQLPLAWWRDLLLMVLRSSVPQQLPALRGIVAMCNRVAAREGQPALPPAPNCRSKSVVNAAFPGRRQHAAAPFAAVMQVRQPGWGARVCYNMPSSAIALLCATLQAGQPCQHAAVLLPPALLGLWCHAVATLFPLPALCPPQKPTSRLACYRPPRPRRSCWPQPGLRSTCAWRTCGTPATAAACLSCFGWARRPPQPPASWPGTMCCGAAGPRCWPATVCLR